MFSESGDAIEVIEGQEVDICFNRTNNLARESILNLNILPNTTTGMYVFTK